MGQQNRRDRSPRARRLCDHRGRGIPFAPPFPWEVFPNLRFVNELPGLVNHFMPRLLVYIFAAVIPRRRMPPGRSPARLGSFRV